MTSARRAGLWRDQRGGAVVELAISTVVVVPLVLYSVWFADAAHWKLKLEEASIGATMDLTAWRVSNFHSSHPEFAHMYGEAIDGASHGSSSFERRMSNSFDSSKPGARPYQSSVFVQPRGLRVTCSDYPASAPGSVVNFDMDESRANDHVAELNTHTWVTCRAEARLKTAGFPQKFEEMSSESWLFRPGWDLISVCGVGPGVQGCGGRTAGLSVMLDDWGLWNHTDTGPGSDGDQNHHEDLDIPLSISDWPVDSPTATTSETTSPHHNDDYFKMAKRFWRSPQQWSPGSVMSDAMAVAGAKEMGKTDWFHLSYRFGAEHSYEAHETLDGQKGAYGGPDGSARPDPHTGGPWHERNADSPSGDPGVSHTTFSNDRAAGHYMGLAAWPADSQ